jgi:hypothetical protein
VPKIYTGTGIFPGPWYWFKIWTPNTGFVSDPGDPALYEFQTLHSIERSYQDDLYAVGIFGYRGNKLLVHWEPGGFKIYGSTEEEMTDVAREFERQFPFPEFYGSQGGPDEFEKIRPYGYELDWEFEAVKGVGDMFGFVATSKESGKFPEGENIFWVFSNDESFRQTAESSRSVHDVFPELMGLDEEHAVLLEDATSFAMARRDKVEGK